MESTNIVGLKKFTIQELEPYLAKAMIVCVIISKQKPKKFTVKNTENQEKAVWNLTVRDSLRDYINVSCWGTVSYIFDMNDKLQIGDVVEITNPRIEIRRVGDHGEQFHPMVTSPFKLTVNENEADIILLMDGYPESLKRIINMPTKPITNYVSLANIHTNVATLEGQCVDILVAVRTVGEIRNVNTRNGESQVRNVIVFDYTNPGLNVSIWDSDYLIRASMWKPRSTILFMTDMRVQFDNYSKSARASFTMRTIVTENPICLEADKLRDYAKTAPIQPSAILDQMAFSIPDPETIQTIMNIRLINSKIDHIANLIGTRPEDQQFTAVVFAAVTNMDLDGLSRVVSTRCSLCKNLIMNSVNTCENEQCTARMGVEATEPEISFDLRMTISDQTGSLVNCRLNGKNAERVLNCSVQEFLAMTDEEKSLIKWKYLMERCELRILVLCVKGKNPLISVIGCKIANPIDLTKRM